MKKQISNHLFPLFLSLFMGALYFLTASRGMFWLDAPRFIAAIYTGGIGNPPEPLYMMLARPFTLLPFGSVVERIQILSALVGALTLFLVYKLTILILNQQKQKSSSAAFFALLSLGFSYQFWTQSQNVENFVLVAFIDTFILLILSYLLPKKRIFLPLTLVFILLGLSSGTNPIAASVLPSVLYFLWLKRKSLDYTQVSHFIRHKTGDASEGSRTEMYRSTEYASGRTRIKIKRNSYYEKIFLLFCLAFITGTLVYLYVFYAASKNPFLNWKRPLEFSSFWGLISGEGLNFNMPERGLLNGFTGSFDVFMLSSMNFLKMAYLNFTPFFLPFIFIGIWGLFKKNRRLFLLLSLTVLTNFLFSGVYLSGNQESWYLISDVILAVFGGLGFFYLISFLQSKVETASRQSAGFFLSGLLFILLFLTLFFRLPTLDRRKWNITADYVDNLYASVKGPALLFGTHDLFDANTYYAYALYGKQTKVIPLGVDYIYDMEWYKKNIALNTDLKFPDMQLKHDNPYEYSLYMNRLFELNLPKYRIYLTVPAIRNNFFSIANFGPSLKIDRAKFKLVPEGMVQELVPIDSTLVPMPEQYRYKFSTPLFPHNLPVIYDRTYKIELEHMIHEYSQSYQLLADYALSNKKPELALEYFRKSYDFDPANIEVIGRLGNFYASVNNPGEAARYFEKGLALNPDNIIFHYNLALLKKNLGRDNEAKTDLARVLELGRDPSRLTSEEAQIVRKAYEILTSPIK